MRVAFDHCVIHVSDWERSNAFYRDVVGAELIDRGHGNWSYRFGDRAAQRPRPRGLVRIRSRGFR